MRDGRSRPRPGIDVQRQRIADAALPLFLTGDPSVLQICEAATVSRPTFYRCFENKHALVDWLVRQAVPIQANLDQLNAGVPPTVAVIDMARTMWQRPLLTRFALQQDTQTLFRETALRVARRLPNASPTLMQALMAACQWVVVDAIDAGLTPAARRMAEQTLVQLVERMLTPAR